MSSQSQVSVIVPNEMLKQKSSKKYKCHMEIGIDAELNAVECAYFFHFNLMFEFDCGLTFTMPLAMLGNKLASLT
jgi:hypothetical protein